MKGWQVEADSSSDEEELTEVSPLPASQTADVPAANYDSDEDFKQEVLPQIEKPEPLLDLSTVDPNKVNWFKYIVDKHLNDDSCLNSTDAYANLLQIVGQTRFESGDPHMRQLRRNVLENRTKIAVPRQQNQPLLCAAIAPVEQRHAAHRDRDVHPSLHAAKDGVGLLLSFHEGSSNSS